jgi:hypothetical protein
MSWRINNSDFLVNFWPLVGGNLQPTVRKDATAWKGAATPAYRDNQFGHSVPEFNNVASDSIIGTETSMYVFTNYSYGAWFTYDVAGAGPSVIMGSANSNSPTPPDFGSELITSSGEAVQFRNSDGVTQNNLAGAGGAINDGLLHHAMGVADDNNLILYIDGEYNNSMARTMTGSPFGAYPMGFGGNNSTAHVWYGTVWGGRFYNVPLTWEEVKYIYDRKI